MIDQEKAGHRLRERFAKSRFDGFHDYAVLEMLFLADSVRIVANFKLEYFLNQNLGLQRGMDNGTDQTSNFRDFNHSLVEFKQTAGFALT